MGRLSSYSEMSKSSATFIESWKEEGRIKVWLHREAPWERRLHSFRRVEMYESKDGPKKSINWFRFVCWEDDEYHRLLRFGDAIPAKLCPACKLLEHLNGRKDLANDDVIFKFKAGKETREILKVDLLGEGKSKESYKDDLSAKKEFILSVIEHDNPSKGVQLANEKYSLGKEVVRRIQNDVKDLGEDVGDPTKRPICYIFEFADRKYSVQRFAEAKLTPAVQKAWEGPAPDASRYVARGNPILFKEAVKDGMKFDLDLGPIFDDAIEAWGGEEEESEDADDGDEADDEQDNDAKDGVRKTAFAKDEEESEEEEPTPKKSAKKAKVEVVEVFECGSCSGDWPENLPNCPKCGAEAVEESTSEKGAGKDGAKW